MKKRLTKKAARLARVEKNIRVIERAAEKVADDEIRPMVLATYMRLEELRCRLLAEVILEHDLEVARPEWLREKLRDLASTVKRVVRDDDTRG